MSKYLPLVLVLFLVGVSSLSFAQDIPASSEIKSRLQLVDVPGGEITIGTPWKVDSTSKAKNNEFTSFENSINPPAGESVSKFTNAFVKILGHKTVELAPFSIGKFEVTNAQYKKFILATGHRFPFSWWDKYDRKEKMEWDRAKQLEALRKMPRNKDLPEARLQFQVKKFNEYEHYLRNWNNNDPGDQLEWSIPYREETEGRGKDKRQVRVSLDQYPVSDMTYDSALAYALWVGARLPTEAEFIRASGAPDSQFPWTTQSDPNGSSFKDLNQEGIIQKEVLPVDKMPQGHQSVHGVWALSGNVAEWTMDAYQPLVAKNEYRAIFSDFSEFFGELAKKNPRRYKANDLKTPNWQTSFRVVKGSSYRQASSHWEILTTSRSDFRLGFDREDSRPSLGFRIARSSVPGRDALISAYELSNRSQLSSSGQIDTKQAVGKEKWNFTDEGEFKGYQAVSFVPYQTVFNTKNQKQLAQASVASPVKIGVLYTSVNLETPKLSPGLYKVYYRDSGLPPRLKKALSSASASKWKRWTDGKLKSKPNWVSTLTSFGITYDQLKSEGKKIRSVFLSSLNARVPTQSSNLVFVALGSSSRDAQTLPAEGFTSLRSRDGRSAVVAQDDEKSSTLHFTAITGLYSGKQSDFEKYLEALEKSKRDKRSRAPKSGASFVEFAFEVNYGESFSK